MTTRPAANGLVPELQIAWRKLREWLPLPETPPPPRTRPAIALEELEEPLRLSLERLLNPAQISWDADDRLQHTGGDNYPAYARRQQDLPPLAVIYPETEQDIAGLMLWASQRDLQLLPWGSGTYPFRTKSRPQAPYMTIDLRRMNRILEITPYKHRVRVQSGLHWSALEAALNEQGVTTGQYFFSPAITVGGSLASGSVSLKSLGYGTLQENVHAARAITPAGPLQLTYPAPGEPDMRGLMIGTQGRWGILTEATLRITTLPAEQLRIFASFVSPQQAREALRLILRQDTRPSCARILSTPEITLLSPPPQLAWLSMMRGMLSNPPPWTAHLEILLEGSKESLSAQRQQITPTLRDFDSEVEINLKNSAGNCTTWHPAQNNLSQLWERGILIYPFIVAVPWATLEQFQPAWEEALQSVLQATGDAPGYTFSSLYATEDYVVMRTLLVGLQAADPVAQLDAIHAVGEEMLARHTEGSASGLLKQALYAAGQLLDPEGVLVR